MNEEKKAIRKNDTWKQKSFPKKKKVIGVRWLYKAKNNVKGETEAHRARLVAKGYKQQQDIHHVNKKSLIAL